MTATDHDGGFPGHSEDDRRVWDANARRWDDRIADGNHFQTLLIELAMRTAGTSVRDGLVVEART